MTSNPPQSLQRLLDEAPFVRLLARELLDAEADEVVQRTWLAAVRHGGEGVAEPRSWLARIVRNVAQNLRRGQQRRDRHERDASPASRVPSSADLLAREEQRRMLVAAVDRLPAPLRTVVLLRYFEGLPPRRIAAELGVPAATVWNRLRQGLQLLRERLDAEHGGQRRAWLLPLVPFATGTPGLPWAGPALPTTTATTLGMGVIAMTMKTKLVAGLAVLLAASGALALWVTRDSVPELAGPPIRVAEPADAATANVPRDAVTASAPDAPVQREAVVVPTTEVSSTGTLVVHVRYGDDQAPAEGVMMIVCRPGADSRVEGMRRTADATGTARFETLAAGRFLVTSDRGWLGKRAEIRGGETTELEYELEVGLTLTGIVVDAVGTPVRGALIEVAPLAQADADAEVMATSGADGRFVVRGAPTETLVGARASGHSSSPLKFLVGKNGNTAELRLELGPPGGSVSGLVVDAHNRPVKDAVVRIGRGSTSGIVASGAGAPPIPALVRTDGDGRFTAVGVPPGNQPVAARARGKAPWQGTCEVTANLTAPLQITLTDGATIHGIARNAAGEVAAQVEIEVGDWDNLDHYGAVTGKDGHFELTGLPAGELVLRAQHDTFGKAEQRAQAVAGNVSQCDLRLSRGLELHGRVVDEQGAAVGKVRLEFLADMSPHSLWWHHARTDPEGRFSVPNCPDGKTLSVTVRVQGFEELQRHDLEPVRGPIELLLQRSMPATVKIRGIVVDPAGQPLPNVMVSANRRDSDRSDIKPTGPDGRFELGPLAPGTWTVTMRSPLYPSYASEPRELAADAAWDLGQVPMVDGGSASVQVEGHRADVHFLILDEVAKTRTGLTDSHGALVSDVLAPGPHHRLFVSGKTVAAQSLSFVVKAGETTKLTVKLSPGVRQRFEIAPPVLLGAPPDRVLFHVHRGNHLVAWMGAMLRRGEPASSEVCLPPGDYRVTVVAAERELATATFTVGTTEAPALRLELR